MSSSGSGSAPTTPQESAVAPWVEVFEAMQVLETPTSSAAERATALVFLEEHAETAAELGYSPEPAPSPLLAAAPAPMAIPSSLQPMDYDVMMRNGFVPLPWVDSTEVLPYMPSVLAGAVAAFDPPPVADLPSVPDGRVKPVALEGTQPKLYKCPYCTMTSERSWNVKEHYPHCLNYSGHPSTLPEFICEHCEKVLTGSGALRNHINGTGKGTRCPVLKKKDSQGVENEKSETDGDDDESEQ